MPAYSAAAVRLLLIPSQNLQSYPLDGMLPDDYVYSGKSNFDYNTFAVIQAYAFDYVINGNVENGKKAIEATRNVVTRFKYKPKASDIVREKGATIYLSAMVYDWCYPLIRAFLWQKRRSWRRPSQAWEAGPLQRYTL